MKAVIYARYSSSAQREESIEGQVKECTTFAERNGYTIIGTYADRAISGTTDNRPQFQKMIADSKRKLFDIVIVWKLDRFARNRYDSARYKNQLKRNGVKVISATEVISQGAEGILLESVLEGMAEWYSEDLKEKVVRGLTINAEKCKWNGGTLPIGYIVDEEQHLQINTMTAPFVLEAFKLYDQGKTITEIRDYLNSKGLTNTKGRPITWGAVQHMLSNRRYIGEYSFQDITIPNGIPTIIPQDLFDRVQERLEKNRKAPARAKAEENYLLTTKLFCGTCHAPMVGECGTSSSQKRKYHYYRCANTKKKKSCDAKRKTVRKLPIENAVVNAVMEKIMDDNFVAYITDTVMEMQTHESSVLPALRKQLEETERGITNMLNAIQAGIFNASTKPRLDELEQRKADIELQIIQEEMRHPMLTREDVTYWFCRYRMLDTKRLEERRRLIDGFVNSVIVYDEYIVITFNYKEGTTTVPFSKLDSSDLSSVGGP